MAVNMVTYLENADSASINKGDIPAKPPLLNIPEVEGRVICFYGFRPVIESMKQVRRESAKKGTSIARISVKAENKSDPRGSMAGLKDEEAISIWRADLPLRKKIAETLKDKLGSTYKGISVTSSDIDDLFEVEPELFNILWAHPLFSHINVFLWRGKYNCASQLGIVRNISLIEEIDVTT